jgi:hypothetical protein
MPSVAGAVAPTDTRQFINSTGSAQDGFGVTYDQVITGITPNPVPPSTTAAPLGGVSALLNNGNSISSAGVIPSDGSTVTFTGSDGKTVMHIVAATWFTGGAAQKAVIYPLFKNRTGQPANGIQVLHVDASGQPVQVFADDTLTIGPDGATEVKSNTTTTIDGTSGTLTVSTTLKSTIAPDSTHYVWKNNTIKIGSAVSKHALNNLAVSANRLTVVTNIPVNQIEPPSIAPFTSVTGLGTTTLTFSGALVPPGSGMLDSLLVLTSQDTGAVDIQLVSTTWQAPSSPVPALPRWSLPILLAALLGAGAIGVRRRRATPAS